MKKIIAVLTAVLLTFAGCGTQNKGTASAGSGNKEVVTFTDALDRKVSIEKNPERVAALIGSFADVWCIAGGTVCASVDDAWTDFRLELDDAVNLGGSHSPSLELLLSANPDFVIASASTASNVEMREALENSGIITAYFDVDCFEDYLAMLDICTDITGRKDLYEKNGVNIKTQIEKIKKECIEADLPESERKVLLIRTAASVIKAKGSEGTILGEMLADLGCINIADSDNTLLDNLSIESVIRQEPYRIFVVTMGSNTQKALDNFNRMMEENPAWGSLEAIKENRMYIMDKKLFNIKPNAKWAQAYEKIREILLETKK